MQTLASMLRVVVIFGVLSFQAQGSHQVRHLRASAAQTLAVLDDEESKEAVQLAEKEAEETVAQAEASDDDRTLQSGAVSLLSEMASLAREKTDIPFAEYAPSCVIHLKKIARTMGNMYGDVQIKRVLKNECHVDKESPTAVDTGFDRYKDCLNFADRFPRAMKDERRGKNGFRKMCKQFFQVQDRQETAANVGSAAKDAAKAALADGKSPEEAAAAAAKAAYKAALAAGKSPEEARAMAAAAAAKVARDQARAAGKSKAEIEAAGRAAKNTASKAVSEEQSKSASGKKKSKKESKKKSHKKASKDKSDEDEESDKDKDEDEGKSKDEESIENVTDNLTEERETAEEEVTADPRRSSEEGWWSWLNRKLFGGHPMYDAKDPSTEDESNVADEQLSAEDASESFLNDTNATNGSKLGEDKRSKQDKEKENDEDMDAEDVVKEAEKESSMGTLDANESANASAGLNESEDEDATSAEEDELEAKEGQTEDGKGDGGLFDWLFGSETYGAPRMKGSGKKGSGKKSKKSDGEDDDDDSSSADGEEDSSKKGGESDDDADEDSSSKKTRGHQRKRRHQHKKASSDDTSTELAKGVTSKDLESLEDFIDEDGSAATAKADDAYINSCVVHLRKVAKVIDKSYSDVQAEEALESQCNLDREFGSVRHESFKRRKECKVFAKLFLKARLQEINGGKTGSYKKLCSWYYTYEDKAFD